MKDPHHGTFAIAYFVVAAILWVAVLLALPIAGLEKTCALAAGSARLGAVFGALERRPSLIIVSLNAMILAGLSLTISVWAWTVIIGVAAFAVLQCALLRRALGALTGDAYGCTIVCAEIAALVALLFLLRS
jgi:cobalamin synthase